MERRTLKQDYDEINNILSIAKDKAKRFADVEGKLSYEMDIVRRILLSFSYIKMDKNQIECSRELIIKKTKLEEVNTKELQKQLQKHLDKFSPEPLTVISIENTTALADPCLKIIVTL